MFAVSGGHTEIVSLLLTKGVDVNSVEKVRTIEVLTEFNCLFIPSVSVMFRMSPLTARTLHCLLNAT